MNNTTKVNIAVLIILISIICGSFDFAKFMIIQVQAAGFVTPITIDNAAGSPQYTDGVTSGSYSWTTTTSAGYFLEGTGARYIDGRAEAWAKWKPSNLTAGYYKVEYAYLKYTKAHTLTIQHNGASDIINVNANGATSNSEWNNCGIFYFTGGSADEYIMANSIATTLSFPYFRTEAVRLSRLDPGTAANVSITLSAKRLSLTGSYVYYKNDAGDEGNSIWQLRQSKDNGLSWTDVIGMGGTGSNGDGRNLLQNFTADYSTKYKLDVTPIGTVNTQYFNQTVASSNIVETISESAPIATVSLKGIGQIGNTLTAGYIYESFKRNDEKDTVWTLWASNDSNFLNKTAIKNGIHNNALNGSEIVLDTYTLQETDILKYFQLELKPKDNAGNEGETVFSNIVGPIKDKNGGYYSNNPIVLDNTDNTTYSESSTNGAWENSVSNGYYLVGNNFRMINGIGTAKWSLNITEQGIYKVEIINCKGNPLSYIVEIGHNGDKATEYVTGDSATNWYSVGHYYFSGGNNEFVQLSNNKAGNFGVDAIRLTKYTAGENDSRLMNLFVDSAFLSSEFSADSYEYSILSNTETDILKLKPLSANTNSEIKVNGQVVANNSWSQEINKRDQVVISVINNSFETKYTLTYVGSESNLLSNLTRGNNNEIIALINNLDYKQIYKKYGLRAKQFCELTQDEKDWMLNGLRKKFNDSYTLETFTSDFNTMLAIAKLNFANKEVDFDKIIFEYNRELQLPINNILYNSYSEGSTFANKCNKIMFMEKTKEPYQSTEMLLSKFINSYALTELNVATNYAQANSAIIKYLNTFGIVTNNNFNSLNDFQKANIYNAMLGQDFTEVSKVKEMFEKLVQTEINNIAKSRQVGPSGGNYVVNSKVNKKVEPDKEIIKFDDLTEFLWAEDSIYYLADKAIVNGYGNNLFKPADNINREEFVKMLILTLNIKLDDGECKFNDVNRGAWYYKYIVTATKKDIIKGYSANRFGVGDNITRQDMAVIIYKALQAERSAQNLRYNDKEIVSDYAIDAVSFVSENKIMNGYNGNYKPKEYANRAEASQVLYNMIQYLKSKNISEGTQ